jgi:hypothetical protein
MMKRRIHYTLIYTLAIFIFFPWTLTAFARDFHDAPFDFFFDNRIDTHQQNILRTKRGDPASLFGFFYIIFTGVTDPVSGLPVARHPRGAGQDEECGVDDINCVVDWIMRRKPGEAKFLYHSGVNGDDHPVWLVNRVQIPQPGSFLHFHWIGQGSNDPRADSVPKACDKTNAGDLEDQEPIAVDLTCPGWFLQIRAVRRFAFEHGGETIPVRPGIDNKSHLNLVTNYRPDLVITPTR